MVEIAALKPDKALRRGVWRARLAARPEIILSPILLVLVLLGWEWGVRLFQVPPYMLPRVSNVLFGLYQGFAISPFSRGGYWLNGGVTLLEVLLGFVIGSAIGLVLGIVISQIRILDATLRPYIVAFQCLPKVAIAPIIIMWFGYDITSKVVMVALLTFFPLLVNSMAGFRGVDLDRIELLRSLSATRWQIFWKVKVPQRPALHLRRARHCRRLRRGRRDRRRIRRRAARPRRANLINERADGHGRQLLGLHRARGHGFAAERRDSRRATPRAVLGAFRSQPARDQRLAALD